MSALVGQRPKETREEEEAPTRSRGWNAWCGSGWKVLSDFLKPVGYQKVIGETWRVGKHFIRVVDENIKGRRSLGIFSDLCFSWDGIDRR